MSSTSDIADLARGLEGASAREILSAARSLFADGIAFAFSGSDDVLTLEFARQIGWTPRVFIIDTGRLHPETLRFVDRVEKHYGLRIEVLFPDTVAVERLVASKGLFSFYEDGHGECCGIRKVEPLRRHLAGLSSWITGQRRDQSPGTRDRLAVVETDAAHLGRDGRPLIKWNPLAALSSQEVWDAIRAFDVPFNELHGRGFASIGCEPCTRAITPGQHERDGRWWWERDTHKECGIHVTPPKDGG